MSWIGHISYHINIQSSETMSFEDLDQLIKGTIICSDEEFEQFPNALRYVLISSVMNKVSRCRWGCTYEPLVEMISRGLSTPELISLGNERYRLSREVADAQRSYEQHGLSGKKLKMIMSENSCISRSIKFLVGLFDDEEKAREFVRSSRDDGVRDESSAYNEIKTKYEELRVGEQIFSFSKLYQYIRKRKELPPVWMQFFYPECDSTNYEELERRMVRLKDAQKRYSVKNKEYERMRSDLAQPVEILCDHIMRLSEATSVLALDDLMNSPKFISEYVALSEFKKLKHLQTDDNGMIRIMIAGEVLRGRMKKDEYVSAINSFAGSGGCQGRADAHFVYKDWERLKDVKDVELLKFFKESLERGRANAVSDNLLKKYGRYIGQCQGRPVHELCGRAVVMR